MSKLLLSVFLIMLGLDHAQACRVRSPEKVNLAVSPQHNMSLFYNSKEVLDERPFWELMECQKTAVRDKYVMIALGINNQILTDENKTYTYSDDFEHSCRVENSPFQKNFNYKTSYEYHMERREFMNKCVKVQVTDFSPRGIQYPEKQEGCTIEKISKNSADFTGRYCFFKPSFESNYSVHLQVKPECMTREGLAKNKVVLGDFDGIVNLYVAGDATGKAVDLTALSTTQVRYSINPLNDVIKSSDDYGLERPTWPANWLQNEIYLGDISVENQNNYDLLRLPLWVDTRCERKCAEDGICSSTCDYTKPVVGEFIIYEINKDGKEDFLTSWYDGGVAPAQWQGQLVGLGQEIQTNLLEPGKDYSLSVTFRDPDVDYGYFSGRIIRKIKLERNYIGPLTRHSEIDRVPEISSIEGMGTIPQISSLYGIRFDGKGMETLPKSLALYRSKIKNKYWPPYYENVCENQSKNCKNIGGEILELKMKFTLGNINKDTDMYEIQNVLVKRKDFLSKSQTGYQKRLKSPEIVCD